jgi:hypothetical protein
MKGVDGAGGEDGECACVGAADARSGEEWRIACEGYKLYTSAHR